MMNLTIERNIKLESHSREFLCDAFYPATEGRWPLVIFAHGYKGYKDWGAWHLMAKSLAEAGYYVVTFNFSHNGTSIEEPCVFADLEAFGNNTFMIELDDLDKVITYFSSKDEVEASQLALIGHSRGGGIVTLKASEDERITGLITLAGVSDFASRFPKGEALKRYLESGVMFTENKRTGQMLPHYRVYYESFLENKDRLNIRRAVESIKRPFLIIAAENDEAVLPQEAKNMKKWNPNAQLKMIPNTGHTFDAKEPWESEKLPAALGQVVEEMKLFLKSNLK